MSTRLTYVPPDMGQTQLVTQADPAVGVQYPNVVVPAGVIWRILGLGLKIQASAVAGNRYPRLILYPAGGVQGFQVASIYTPITVNQQAECNWIIGMGFGTGTLPGGGDVVGPNARLTGLPTELDLIPGDAIEMNVQQLLGGDQLSDYELVVKVWRVV